jgi:hypothetical protein
VHDHSGTFYGASGLSTREHGHVKATRTNTLAHRRTGDRDHSHPVLSRKFQELWGNREKTLVEPRYVDDEVSTLGRWCHERNRGRDHHDFTPAQLKDALNFVTRRATRGDEHRAASDRSLKLFDSLMFARLAAKRSQVIN